MGTSTLPLNLSQASRLVFKTSFSANIGNSSASAIPSTRATLFPNSKAERVTSRYRPIFSNLFSGIFNLETGTQEVVILLPWLIDLTITKCLGDIHEVRFGECVVAII